jgi:RNA-binding protein 39
VALLAKLSNMTADAIKNIGGTALFAALNSEHTLVGGTTSSNSSSSSALPTVPSTNTPSVSSLPPVLAPSLPVSLVPSSSVPVSIVPSTTTVTLLPTVSIVPSSYSLTPPTSCVLLKNMFNPATETEPDWIKDIIEEVQEELGKFGKIQNIYVNPISPEGLIYVLYQNDYTSNGIQAVIHATQTLNGKKFGGQVIQLEPVPIEVYRTIFPV